MKNINQYNFDIIHVATHLRDTLEYVLPREHQAAAYEQRKAVLKKGLEEETPLGKFLAANKDKFEKFLEQYNELLNEVYGEDSTILVKTNDGKIRVDHSQHIRLYELVTELMEPLRDIIYFHVNLARQQNENEDLIEDLMPVDDRYYRLFTFLLIMQDFQKSFFEFQKVMGENNGKPSPQSNFIVQNELAKYAQMLRNIRAHNHCTDNETLDLLDEVNATIEMTEGRRDRRENKSFKELFEIINQRLSGHVAKYEPQWKAAYDKLFKQMVELAQNANPANKPQEA